MKILQINCVYKKGSTGKIVYELHSGLEKAGYDSVVCYGRGGLKKEENVYKTCSENYAKANKLISMFTGLMYGGCYFSTACLINHIVREKPDIVHLHCLNGNFVNIYRLITFLKNQRIKTVLTLHAEFMYTANCGYALECDRWKSGCGKCPRLRQETGSLLFDQTAVSWKKMKKAFKGFDDYLTVVSVSPWLFNRAKQSPILSLFDHEIVLNGVNGDVFHVYEKNRLRIRHNLLNKKVVFHATPKFDDSLSNIKGGRFVIQVAEKLKKSGVMFVIAGTYPQGLKVPENVILLDKIENQEELAEYYSMADVSLLTSEKETFSMIVAESLCCGTPIVGFKAGAPEQITISEYSAFSEFGDIGELIQNLEYWLKRDVDSQKISVAAHKKYTNGVMYKNYYSIYRRIYDESGK